MLTSAWKIGRPRIENAAQNRDGNPRGVWATAANGRFLCWIGPTAARRTGPTCDREGVDGPSADRESNWRLDRAERSLMNRSDFQQLSDVRQREAETLLSAGEPAGTRAILRFLRFC
jgi:hypothetical protein